MEIKSEKGLEPAFGQPRPSLKKTSHLQSRGQEHQMQGKQVTKVETAAESVSV
jgi:hypothetical protein